MRQVGGIALVAGSPWASLVRESAVPLPRRLLHVRSLGRPAAPPWPGVVRAQRWVTPVQGLGEEALDPRDPEKLRELVGAALEDGERSWVVFEAVEPLLLFAGIQPLAQLLEEAERLVARYRGLFAAGYEQGLASWPAFATILEQHADWPASAAQPDVAEAGALGPRLAMPLLRPQGARRPQPSR